ncbi:hypothetical protein SCB49_14315 [unidentified eubacterium SCB49]|nr:hypothetical protein SCB49_14315 [unidentified eubacterium SCB49]
MLKGSVLIHPGYFPTISQMAVVAQAENIVFEAEDNYQKQTYRNRTLISQAQGTLLLNVPILHTKGVRKKYVEVQVENQESWQSHHLKSLQTAYRTSPYFEYYEDEITHLFTDPVTSLFDHNVKIHQELCELLGIDTPFIFTEEFEKEPKGIIDARNSIDAKVKLDITFPKYIQVFQERNGFYPNLSILDLLFNEGPNAISYLEKIKLPY